MQGKLSDLVDNLSGIFNKECKSCTKKKKKKKSDCDFIGFRDSIKLQMERIRKKMY